MLDALITADNISLNHNGKNILDDVSLKLHPGEFITLIGPNGAGKSSLIKVLLGIIRQDSGQVSHSNNVRLGYTPQSFTANPFIPISVVDFLTLNQKTDKNFTNQTSEKRTRRSNQTRSHRKQTTIQLHRPKFRKDPKARPKNPRKTD